MKPYLSVHWPFHLGRVKFFPMPPNLYHATKIFPHDRFCLADAAHYYFPAIFIWREGARRYAREIATPVPQPTSPLPAFWLVELLLGDMLYVIVLWYSEKLQLWIRKQSRLDRVSLAQVVLSRYFSHTSWMVLINNYSKSPNGLWVNSPVGLQPHRLLTQSPFRLQE